MDLQEEGSVTHAVTTENLVKHFGPVQALRGVSLRIPTGSTFGLVGPNGAGKTTLFSIVAGFLRPTSGSVNVLGAPVAGENLLGKLSVLPQDAAFRKGVPMGNQLALCARLQGYSKAQADSEVQRVLELTGMEGFADRVPDKLSHGMAKRMAIAQALMGDPQIILLDEPLAGLDPAQARRIRLLIQQEAGGHRDALHPRGHHQGRRDRRPALHGGADPP
jgi:ABC-2 type transport system ATP-binding protein